MTNLTVGELSYRVYILLALSHVLRVVKISSFYLVEGVANFSSCTCHPNLKQLHFAPGIKYCYDKFLLKIKYSLDQHQEGTKVWQDFCRLQHHQVRKEQWEWKISTWIQIREVHQAYQKQNHGNQGNSCGRQVWGDFLSSLNVLKFILWIFGRFIGWNKSSQTATNYWSVDIIPCDQFSYCLDLFHYKSMKIRNYELICWQCINELLALKTLCFCYYDAWLNNSSFSSSHR